MPKPSNSDVLLDWMSEHLGEEGRRYVSESARLALAKERQQRSADGKPSQLERVLRRLLGRIDPDAAKKTGTP